MVLNKLLELFSVCRFSNIHSTNPSTFLEYHYGLCSAIANEVKLKLNIWDVKYGAKESVESLLENWNVSFRYMYHILMVILSQLSLIQSYVSVI